MKLCVMCGKVLAAKNVYTRCTDCSRIYKNEQAKERRARAAKWIDCTMCGKNHRRRPNSTYCSPACSNRADEINTAKYIDKIRVGSKECAICNRLFPTSNSGGKRRTCSDQCSAELEEKTNIAYYPKLQAKARQWALNNPDRRREIAAKMNERNRTRRQALRVMKLQQLVKEKVTDAPVQTR